MRTKRTTITITEELYALAKQVMKARTMSDFSGFVQTLIREEYERRGGVIELPKPDANRPQLLNETHSARASHIVRSSHRETSRSARKTK